MWRRVFRVILAVLVAYLLQSTMLPYFRIRGVTLDIVPVTLYTIGYACGMYAGFTSGVLCALIMESVAGDLGGVVSVVCVGAGVFGGWSFRRIQNLSLVGNRRLEQMIKRFAPMVLIALLVMFKEFVYMVYFYLTGVDLTFTHIYKMLLAGIMAGVFSLVWIPVLYGFLLRKKEDTFFYKRIEKQKAKRKAKMERRKLREKLREERRQKEPTEPEPLDLLEVPFDESLVFRPEGGEDR